MSFTDTKRNEVKKGTIRYKKSANSPEQKKKPSDFSVRQKTTHSLSPIRNVMSPVIGPVMKSLRRFSKPSDIATMRAFITEKSKADAPPIDDSFVALDEGDSSGAGDSLPSSSLVEEPSRMLMASHPLHSSGSVGNSSVDAFELLDRKDPEGRLSIGDSGIQNLMGPSGIILVEDMEEGEMKKESEQKEASQKKETRRHRSRSERRSRRAPSNPPKEPLSVSANHDKPPSGKALSSSSPISSKNRGGRSHDKVTTTTSASQKPPNGRSAGSGTRKPHSKPISEFSALVERATKAGLPRSSSRQRSSDRSKHADQPGVSRHAIRTSDGGTAPPTGRQVTGSPKRRRAKSLDQDELLSPSRQSLRSPSPGESQRRHRSKSRGPASSAEMPLLPERARSMSRDSSLSGASGRRNRERDHKSSTRRASSKPKEEKGETGDLHPADRSRSRPTEVHDKISHKQSRSKTSSRRSLSRPREEKPGVQHASGPSQQSPNKSEKVESSSHRRNRTASPVTPLSHSEGRQQQQSGSRDNPKRSSDVPSSPESETPKPYRRGKRPSPKSSIVEESIPTEAMSEPVSKEDVGTEKPDSGRSIGSQDTPEKPVSSRQSGAERFNLAKEALANVRDIKEDFKQMRSHRRRTGPDSPIKAPIDSSVQPQPSKVPLPARSSPASRARRLTSPMAAAVAPLHHSLGSLNSPRLGLHSTAANSDLRTSGGAISLDDLDIGFVNRTSSLPIATMQELRIQELQKLVKETKKLIKRTTQDIWTEREEIIAYQQKNWSMRKSLMQGDGPPDSVTSLNLKIERLLRQQHELDMDADQFREQKDTVGVNCDEMTARIADTKSLFDKLTQVVVPLLPPQQPNVSGAREAWTQPGRSGSPMLSPSSIIHKLQNYPAMMSSSENEEDSIHSEEDDTHGLSDNPVSKAFHDGLPR